MIAAQCARLVFALLAATLWGVTASVAGAQITLDGTLGPQGALTGPDFVIDAALGQQAGANLFQSFGQFNIHANESVTFSGPASVENVIGRVTGGNASLIDGRLRCTIPNANLYLINPSGVMFGPDAALDVQGSFAVSTADYVKLGASGRFDARQLGNSVLTSAPPSAFGFLGDHPAFVSLDHSTLAVPDGRTLSIIAGDLSIEGGSVSAQGGRINLASVASPGEVIPNPPGQGADLDVRSVSKLGSITVSDGARIDSSGEGGGTIVIRGGRFELNDASMVRAITNGAVDGDGIGIAVDALTLTGGSKIDSSTYGVGRAGAVTVEAGTLTLSDGAEISSSTVGVGRAGTVTIKAGSIAISGENGSGFGSGIFSEALGTGDVAGDAGAVLVEAGSLTLSDGAEISSTTLGVGRAGTVTVRATGSIAISGEDSNGFGSGILSNAQGAGDAAGDAGAVTVEAGTLTLSAGGEISSTAFGVGRAGTVTIKAGSIALSGENSSGFGSGIFSEALGTGDVAGDAGAVLVEAGSLTLSDGAEISSTTLGVGRAGTVTVRATGSIAISGEDSNGFGSGILSNAQGTGDAAGDAGAVTVEAGTLTLSAGGEISSTTFGVGRAGTVTIKAGSIAISGQNSSGFGSGIFSEALGTGDVAGDAGAVLVEAGSLTLSDGGEISSTTLGVGHGGDVEINVNALTLTDGAAIGAQSDGPADAGRIRIRARDAIHVRDASITTAAVEAFGGSIQIEAGSLFDLQHGAITTSVHSGSGDGGNIVISAPSTVLDQSRIIARADVGNGGNIAITAAAFVASPDSEVDASSNKGINGAVLINSPETNLAGVLRPVPQSLLQADALLGQRCAARAGRRSSLVVLGPDALPVDQAAGVHGGPRSNTAVEDCP